MMALHTNSIAVNVDCPEELRSSSKTSVLGWALYVNASNVNHGCGSSANAEWFHVKTVLHLRLIDNATEAEEIAVSYIEIYPGLSALRRRQILRSGFHFDCLCLKCAEAIKTTAQAHPDGKIVCVVREEDLIAKGISLENWLDLAMACLVQHENACGSHSTSTGLLMFRLAEQITWKLQARSITRLGNDDDPNEVMAQGLVSDLLARALQIVDISRGADWPMRRAINRAKIEWGC
jgi:hypothetical protein